MKTFGYVRVSTREQNPKRQIDELKKYVSDERDIIVDRITGKVGDRPGLDLLKRLLRPGDELYIHELDRLGRNKKIIKDQLLYFREKEITVRVLDVPTTLIDFSNYGELGKSIMDMVNNLLIEVLSTLAETEMLRTKKRQAEGIAAARARGIKLGRPKKVLPPEFFPIYDRWIKKEITAVEAFHTLGISKDTFYRWVRQYKGEVQNGVG